MNNTNLYQNQIKKNIYQNNYNIDRFNNNENYNLKLFKTPNNRKEISEYLKKIIIKYSIYQNKESNKTEKLTIDNKDLRKTLEVILNPIETFFNKKYLDVHKTIYGKELERFMNSPNEIKKELLCNYNRKESNYNPCLDQKEKKKSQVKLYNLITKIDSIYAIKKEIENTRISSNSYEYLNTIFDLYKEIQTQKEFKKIKKEINKKEKNNLKNKTNLEKLLDGDYEENKKIIYNLKDLDIFMNYAKTISLIDGKSTVTPNIIKKTLNFFYNDRIKEINKEEFYKKAKTLYLNKQNYSQKDLLVEFEKEKEKKLKEILENKIKLENNEINKINPKFKLNEEGIEKTRTEKNRIENIQIKEVLNYINNKLENNKTKIERIKRNINKEEFKENKLKKKEKEENREEIEIKTNKNIEISICSSTGNYSINIKE